MVNFREYLIKQGDNLHIIAQKMYGDSGKAFDIAIANDLEYPFISNNEDYSDRSVRGQGDIILIPFEVSVGESILQEKDENIEILGSDFVLTPQNDMNELSSYPGGDMSVDSYGDLSTLQGVDSLHQDLIHRLTTEIGTLPYHPDYGSDFNTIIGNKNTYGWRQKASLELQRCFTSDLRVIGVDNIDLQVTSDGINISCEVVVIEGKVNIKHHI